MLNGLALAPKGFSLNKIEAAFRAAFLLLFQYVFPSEFDPKQSPVLATETKQSINVKIEICDSFTKGFFALCY